MRHSGCDTGLRPALRILTGKYSRRRRALWALVLDYGRRATEKPLLASRVGIAKRSFRMVVCHIQFLRTAGDNCLVKLSREPFLFQLSGSVWWISASWSVTIPVQNSIHSKRVPQRAHGGTPCVGSRLDTGPVSDLVKRGPHR